MKAKELNPLAHELLSHYKNLYPLWAHHKEFYLNCNILVNQTRIFNMCISSYCLLYANFQHNITLNCLAGRRGRDHMVVAFTTLYAISVYHN